MAKETNPALDPEIESISKVFAALKELDRESQARVVEYVRLKLGLPGARTTPAQPDEERPPSREPDQPAPPSPSSIEGISPIAEKWLRRSGLSAPQLERVFSIGAGDEIDLVADKLPSKTKAARARDVILLKAVASYLSNGVPKVGHEIAKQTCEHYDAYDTTNFSKIFKTMAPELSGSKQSGYTLTARGLAAAADLIKQMAGTG